MKLIRINQLDNIAVLIVDIKAGDELLVGSLNIIAKENIEKGHKICIKAINKNENVIKYGSFIGRATSDIDVGAWVHSHNTKTNLSGILEYSYNPVSCALNQSDSQTFMGFLRNDKTVGIRNEIWIIPTVGCVNSIAEIIAKEATKLVNGSIDGVYAFPHPYGCSQLGQDLENTQKALCGLIRHPNAGGVLVLGLGCENNEIDMMKKMIGDYDEKRVKFLVAQKCDDEISESLKLLEEITNYAKAQKRVDCPVSELIIGLKCGGSDGFSGITANPLVGKFSDKLIANGGSTILTEVPEMFGAEALLMNRCETETEFLKMVELINDFKKYFIRYNQEIYENPSPGNKAGGITTLEDKSLGCTQKGGTAPVVDVLRYGDRVKKKGLNALYAPGNDLVAATAEAVSGAHMILFTTGRGTPFGSPVPTVKISSNTQLFESKKSWIDFNAGELINGQSMEETVQTLFNYVKSLASGEIKSKTEQNGIRDFSIFKDGVTL